MIKNSQESHFTFDEIFFSKTDKKGILLSGNSVFQRVSEYSWGELVGKPHNIVRHPDMPKGVFHLLWENLNSNKPIGAFVKNKSKTGKHYWVFALAMPIADGHLSVRIKPGGDLLTLVEKEYAYVREKEKHEGLAPRSSQAAILQRLNELGFPNYSAFMAHALTDQIESRCKALQIDLPYDLVLIRKMRDQSSTINECAKQIVKANRESKFVPLNLEVYAAKLGNDGTQLSVVANQYQKMVEEINCAIGTLDQMAKEVIEKLQLGQLLLGARQLMRDMNNFFKNEASGDDTKNAAQDLEKLSLEYTKASKESVEEIVFVLNKFEKICESLESMGSGLELVRLSGKMEGARLQQSCDVTAMLNDLRAFQSVFSSRLRQMLESQGLIKGLAKDLLKSMSR